MTAAQIIPFPSRSPQLRLAIEVAIEHLNWLRRTSPGITPLSAALRIGMHANTWTEALNAYAATWESYPQPVDKPVDKSQPVNPGDK